MLFLSIHPEHVEAIIDGRKTVELRKRKPSIAPGFKVVIYATMPQCEVVAVGTIEAIHVGEPGVIWNDFGKLTAVSEETFGDYFDGSDKAVGIELSKIVTFKTPVSLRELRQKWDGFQPPQQYRYLDPKQRRFIKTREKSLDKKSSL